MKKRILPFLVIFLSAGPASGLEFDKPYGVVGADLGVQSGPVSSRLSTVFRSSVQAGFGQDVYLNPDLVFSLFGRLKSFPTSLWGNGGFELASYDVLPDFDLFLDGSLEGQSVFSPTYSLWLSAEKKLPLELVGKAEAGGFRTSDSLGCWGKGGLMRKFWKLRLFLDGTAEWERTFDDLVFPSFMLSLGGRHPFLLGSSLWALGEYRFSEISPSLALVSGMSWVF
ncbi:MAG TPA: hypothetical protein DD435_01405 [Cyanobacteria bacterium UBA8530]|nr:hypothetical protein [Cyanobacteria bacterium UBA8530]